MTAVFISYERSAAATAQRVAARLRADGREVWLDTELPPDRLYADVINERLQAAGAVVVLWSKAASASEWVRAEADLARQHHKLVQATLDDTLPPMPFNQVQCAKLKSWRGDADHPEWAKVVRAVDGLIRVGALAADRPSARRRLRPVAWRWIAGAAVVALVAAGLWLARERLSGVTAPAATRVAILPFRVLGPGAQAHTFADALIDKIQGALNDNQIQVVSRSDAEALAGPNRDQKIRDMGVKLLFNGSVQDDGKATEVAMHLDDAAHHVTLWSSNFSDASDRAEALQGGISGRVVAVLNCSSRALSPTDGLIDPEVLSQYLLACDLFARSGENDPQMTFKMLSALRQVAARAPRFPPAHAALAKFLAYSAPVMPPEQGQAYSREAKAEADKAIALDPKNADAYVGLELLEPAANWAQREALLRKGLAGDPDWTHANGFLGQTLGEVGRLQEAVVYSQRASAQTALGETWVPPTAVLLISAGRTVEADALLTSLEANRKDSANDWRYRLIARTNEGRWDDAIAVVDEPMAARVMPASAIAAERDFLQTAKSPTPPAVARQRAALLASAGASKPNLESAISHLSTLGLLDDAFRLAEQYRPDRALTGGNAEFLFGPQMAPMRRDPRFMQFATRIGLVDYWRKTGKWPDFCRDPALPYRCQ
ncbi:TIR domain-containing protein [Phenylobacterium sp.]|uniref:TIR domain-containing protein n=1 Tax=Phenylobacterium sp. TaxID=1871053 RepID=UPI00356748A4